MGYVNGIDKEAFLDYMRQEFSSVYGSAFVRELLENVVDYGMEHHSVSKNGLYYYLMDMVPQIEAKDLVPFIDKNLLTNEVLVLAEQEEIVWQRNEDERKWEALRELFDFAPCGVVWGLSLDKDIFWELDNSDGFLEDLLSEADSEQLEAFVADCLVKVKESVEDAGMYVFDELDYGVIREKIFEGFRECFGIEDKKVDELIDEAVHECEGLNNGVPDKADFEFGK